MLTEERLAHLDSDSIPESWTEIERTKQFDLLEFYNVADSSISIDDLEILADLFHGITGSISWVDCDDCGIELCLAYPNSWDSFQGVRCANEDSCGMQECCAKSIYSEE